MRTRWHKAPDEHLDYGWDWSAWLGADVIEHSVMAVDDGLTLTAAAHDGATTKAWLSGGQPGLSYWVVNRITTRAGRTAVRARRLKIVPRRVA